MVEQAAVPAGSFLMGDSSGDRNPFDGEEPVHDVSLEAFWIDATTVTNDDFTTFAEATGYKTDAERFGYSAVFHSAFQASEGDIISRPQATPWWLGVRGANWRHPNGRWSDLTEKDDHPVVHMSWNDALAYCQWAGRRLPTEAEWERASRGSLQGARYPWGDTLLDDAGGWLCNIWQGHFPAYNSGEDGWLTTAPVRSYKPNGLGLWQTVGNVWEWCADVFDTQAYARQAEKHVQLTPAQRDDSQAGALRVLRGGSYLCHASYCNRYRNSARSSNSTDSSMGNAGFRTVASNPSIY